MRYLVLSDIHGNWEALAAVLAASEGAHDSVVCLGDVVGYGADPNRCVEWTREHASPVVRGNHDRASAGEGDLSWFNEIAAHAILWTRNALAPENALWLRDLPRGPAACGGFQIAHGSPLDEDGYLVHIADAEATFPYLETPLVFFGHTHLQGWFLWARLRSSPFRRPPGEFVLDLRPGDSYLINPGSVGQPRDGDPRAAYAIYDDAARTVAFHRAAYDLASAQARIREAGLPEMLAARLAEGR
ncbi:MAG: metallophosphoesterase family protein [Bryobacterales bacterium]|nr:metallophosphoesterase family protein [Bryobacterales bacterium]